MQIARCSLLFEQRALVVKYLRQKFGDAADCRVARIMPSRDKPEFEVMAMQSRKGSIGGSQVISRDQTPGEPGQLAAFSKTTSDVNMEIATELPEFTDGSSIFAYARSAPTMNVDPHGLFAGRPGPRLSSTPPEFCTIAAKKRNMADCEFQYQISSIAKWSACQRVIMRR